MSEFTFDARLTAEGAKKLAATRNIPKAQKKNLTDWGANTLRDVKESARLMKKSAEGWFKKRGGSKSGQMSRNTRMKVDGADGDFILRMGTGVAGAQSVKYAEIQDKGGITRPEVTDKMRRFFWAKYYASGETIQKYKRMALTKEAVLNVFIPRSHWFTGPIEKNQASLQAAVSPDEVLKTAEEMAGAATPAEWR